MLSHDASLLPCFFIFPLFSFQGAIEGVPSKLNNVRDSSKLEQKRSDLGMLHETRDLVNSP